jgi:hypothetical protein
MVMTAWAVKQPSEALTLVANTFVTSSRDWTAKTGQRIRLSTYLFPDDAHLAEEYLDATARYLDVYIPLLGPYPFEKFAVVENFFASGLGMPSFTLLGSGVIKRHYVQPYALGHEIVHSWIGNAVFNRADRGNWVEGLTTYLANYYWHELMGDRAQARDQRRLMVQSYNLHVPPERDYPVAQFTQKRDEHDNAIGYQKAAMLFHLLRQEVGEEAFWRSLTSLVAQYRGKHAEWRDLERVFAEESRRDLRWFFAQWVEQDGAPVLSLPEAVARPVAGGAALLAVCGGYQLFGRSYRDQSGDELPGAGVLPLHTVAGERDARKQNERTEKHGVRAPGTQSCRNQQRNQCAREQDPRDPYPAEIRIPDHRGKNGGIGDAEHAPAHAGGGEHKPGDPAQPRKHGGAQQQRSHPRGHTLCVR